MMAKIGRYAPTRSTIELISLPERVCWSEPLSPTTAQAVCAAASNVVAEHEHGGGA
jgi:hypothetical protein